MKKTIAGFLGILLTWCISGAALCDETVFSGGETSSAEAFGSGEGVFYFSLAILSMAAIYGMILLSRSVHRRVETALDEVEKRIAEKKS